MAHSDHTAAGKEWKPIPDFEGFYEAHPRGLVRRSKTSQGARAGHILVLYRNTRGYERVWLQANGRRRYVYVHHVILRTFDCERVPGQECNHEDGDPANNNIANLEWVTHQQNMLHKCRILKRGLGEDNGFSRLTTDAVRQIKARLAAGESQSGLARRFGVGCMTINWIAKGKTWRHVS